MNKERKDWLKGRGLVLTVFLVGIIKFAIGRDYGSVIWNPNIDGNRYRNPIVYADYSDPDIVRVDDNYFMTASSFNCSPGLPILHSKDLVNWTIINHALSRLVPEEVFSRPQHGKGVWAPSIRYYNNEFYIYWGDPDYGVYMTKTKNPYGKWKDPVLVKEGRGIIDPCPLWDDDGNVYLITGWAASRSGINSLLTVWQMNEEGTRVISDGIHVFDGHDEHHTVEGPKFYKRDGYYYILAPAGGVSTGWQLALRSKQVYGPYEEKVVLSQGETDINGPHQGAWVEAKSGDSWFVHFQDKKAYGRILHLQPVKWKDGWPIIGIDPDGDGCGEPVSEYLMPASVNNIIGRPAESDEFNDGEIGKQWQWAANYNIKWNASIIGKDYLRLLAYPTEVCSQRLWNTPNLLLQKFPAPSFVASTKLKLSIEWDEWKGKKAGLIVTGNDYSYLSISKDNNGFVLEQVQCINANNGGEEKVVASARLSSGEVVMRVSVEGAAGKCHFSFSEDGEDYKEFGIPFTAKPELWIGSKVGIFCVTDPSVRKGSYADFDWFRITPHRKLYF